MEVLTDKGEEKLQRAKRIPVLQDNPTTRIVALSLKVKTVERNPVQSFSFQFKPGFNSKKNILPSTQNQVNIFTFNADSIRQC